MSVCIIGGIGVIVFILVHLDSCQKAIIHRVIESDFMLITGNDSQTFSGGIITFVYFVANFFILMGLIQE